jgi:DNA-binding CsgD family transcriptional regulator
VAIQRQELIDKASSLEKANEALKHLLDQREIEKKAIEQTMLSNLKKYVFPYLAELEGLKIGNSALSYVNIIRTNIELLVSPVSQTLGSAYGELTAAELKVADLIRQGRTTKAISDILGISPSTVEKHRNKIRKKLNILNTKKNLRTYLNSLS